MPITKKFWGLLKLIFRRDTRFEDDIFKPLKRLLAEEERKVHQELDRF